MKISISRSIAGMQVLKFRILTCPVLAHVGGFRTGPKTVVFKKNGYLWHADSVEQCTPNPENALVQYCNTKNVYAPFSTPPDKTKALETMLNQKKYLKIYKKSKYWLEPCSSEP